MLLGVTKKERYFRVRSDDELKAALKTAAEKAFRKEADHARYLLRIILGLSEPEQFDEITLKKARAPSQRTKGKAAGGHGG
ncbi:MAG: hypothetical protein FJ245_15435 [Nitrospira sp.]|nr:hypothetical protein [Nitrospira sp.]